MSYDPERLSKKDTRRMTRFILGWCRLAGMALSISLVVSMGVVLVLRLKDVIPLGSSLMLYVQGFHVVLMVPVGVVAHRRRRDWLRHAYAVDGRICVMCGYTLDSDHDGMPCPECGVVADFARYRRLWIEFAGGWKQWPTELVQKPNKARIQSDDERG